MSKHEYMQVSRNLNNRKNLRIDTNIYEDTNSNAIRNKNKDK